MMTNEVIALDDAELNAVSAGVTAGTVLVTVGFVGLALALAPEAAATAGIIVGAEAIGASINLIGAGLAIS
jgi:hypothetical protein